MKYVSGKKLPDRAIIMKEHRGLCICSTDYEQAGEKEQLEMR